MVQNLLGKRQGAVGLAYERTPGSAEALPVYVLPCDSANIEVAPVTYERTNNLDENPIGIEQSGFEYSFSISGMEVDNETAGYISWLFLGTEVNTTGSHVITPTFNSPEFTVFKDHGGSIYDTDKRTEVLQGCKITEFSIEQPNKGYAKISLSGWGQSKSWISTALTRTLSFGADATALHWNAVMDSTNKFRLVANEGVFSGTFSNMTSYKVSMSRELTRSGMNLSTDDARGLVEGGRTCEIEFTLDTASGPNAFINLLLDAVENAKRLKTEINWEIGATTFSVLVPTARITNSPKGELGTGTDPQQITVQASAFRYDAGLELVTITSDTPSAATDYDTRAGA